MLKKLYCKLSGHKQISFVEGTLIVKSSPTKCVRCGELRQSEWNSYPYYINEPQKGKPVHVVFFSGGKSSFETLHRVIKRFGKTNLLVLFADTKYEDEDLYRFMREVASSLGVIITSIEEGRTPLEVFFDVKFLGNSRIDPCSKILKRELIKNFLRQFFPPDSVESVLFFGIGEKEKRRNSRIISSWGDTGYTVDFPLQWEDYTEDLDIFSFYEIDMPRLYTLGFIHNNCGGTCVKAGQKQWLKVLQVFPDRYAEWEQAEKDFSLMMGKDYTILRKMEDGLTYPLSLSELRTRDTGKKVILEEWDTQCVCFAGDAAND